MFIKVLLSSLVLSSFNVFAEELKEHPSIIQHLKHEPINAGVNPDFGAIRITGRITTGSNPCQAIGHIASLKQETKNNTIKVYGIVSYPAEAEMRICTKEYNPVSQDVSLDLRFNRKEIKKIRIIDVENKGTQVSIKVN